MDKVTDKWFEDRGWTREEQKTWPGRYEDLPSYQETTKHTVKYSLNAGGIEACYECVVFTTTPTRRNEKKRIERLYKVDIVNGRNNRQRHYGTSHRRFAVDEIESAIRIVSSSAND